MVCRIERVSSASKPDGEFVFDQYTGVTPSECAGGTFEFRTTHNQVESSHPSHFTSSYEVRAIPATNSFEDESQLKEYQGRLTGVNTMTDVAKSSARPTTRLMARDKDEKKVTSYSCTSTSSMTPRLPEPQSTTSSLPTPTRITGDETTRKTVSSHLSLENTTTLPFALSNSVVTQSRGRSVTADGKQPETEGLPCTSIMDGNREQSVTVLSS